MAKESNGQVSDGNVRVYTCAFPYTQVPKAVGGVLERAILKGGWKREWKRRMGREEVGECRCCRLGLPSIGGRVRRRSVLRAYPAQKGEVFPRCCHAMRASRCWAQPQKRVGLDATYVLHTSVCTTTKYAREGKGAAYSFVSLHPCHTACSLAFRPAYVVHASYDYSVEGFVFILVKARWWVSCNPVGCWEKIRIYRDLVLS